MFSDKDNMKVLKLAFAITFLLSFIGCSRQFQIARVVPGHTYVDEALNLLDEPDIAEQSTISRSHAVYVWRDVTLQINSQEVVTAVHRKPASHEKTLQFWKQYYQNENTDFKRVQSLSKSQESLWLFDIPHRGMSAVYDENIDEVTKVILYETR